jgi:hypothetical protein
VSVRALDGIFWTQTVAAVHEGADGRVVWQSEGRSIQYGRYILVETGMFAGVVLTFLLWGKLEDRWYKNGSGIAKRDTPAS